ncbi:MAG: VanW family protein [Micrococcales bacterium]|nr:VanW family protein [Micrococcales bacterium]
MTRHTASERGSAAVTTTITILVLLVLAAGGYVAAAKYFGGRLPKDTTVAGVQIGGMTPEQARTTLESGLTTQATMPVRVMADGKELALKPADAGMSFDIDKTLDGLTGDDFDPRNVWHRVTGSVERDPVAKIDTARLTTAVKDLAEQVDRPAKEGSVAFKDGKVAAVTSVEGRRFDVDQTVRRVSSTWPGSRTVDAPVEKITPELGAAEITRFRKDFADKAVSGPVTVVVGKQSFPVPTTAYAPAIEVVNTRGRLSHKINEARIVKAVGEVAAQQGVAKAAKDATWSLSGTEPKVTPSADGLKLDDKSIAKTFTTAITSTDRRAVVGSSVTKPKVTTAAATAKAKSAADDKKKVLAAAAKAAKAAAGQPGLISTFSTNLTGSSGRVANIQLAARTLNGTFVAKGEQFSLNGVLGERTAGKGYHEAPVIMNGRLIKDYGGGISQLSTTTLNAAWFAGVQLDEYMPHSFYISRYPEGREATISWPNVDQKWTNTTNGGLLIKASAGGGKVTVSLYGVKTFDVASSKGPRRNVIQPKVIKDDSEGCVPQTPTPGFDVTVTRTISQGGKVVKSENHDTHYIPEDDVTCTHPKAGN